MSRQLLLIFLFLFSCPSLLFAQRFSYVYIQGDKQTPFYVKLNGAMLPRYGKNYCILSQLEPGSLKLEILYQQNAFPAQQYTILVPENGSRAFMLTKRDGIFTLYDLQQQFYLSAGNLDSDDHLPTQPAAPQAIVAEPNAASDTFSTIEDGPLSPPVATKNVDETTPKTLISKQEKKKKTEEIPLKPSNTEPDFLDITLSNNHTEAPAIGNEKPIGIEGDTLFTQKKPLDGTFRNSDCLQPLPDKDFERIYKTMIEKDADEDRVAFLNTQLNNCYQTWQVRTLGSMLAEDAARFTFLKNVYPRITDQQAFPLLDDMLRSDVWKTQFLKLTQR